MAPTLWFITTMSWCMAFRSRFIWDIFLNQFEVEQLSAYDDEVLRWSLLELLEQHRNDPVLRVLRPYLQQDEHELAGFQLAQKLAGLFNQYLIYRPAMVERLAQRLGWSRHDDPLKIEQDLMALVPKSDWTLWAHLLIDHGRAVCKARKPLWGGDRQRGAVALRARADRRLQRRGHRGPVDEIATVPDNEPRVGIETRKGQVVIAAIGEQSRVRVVAGKNGIEKRAIAEVGLALPLDTGSPAHVAPGVE